MIGRLVLIAACLAGTDARLLRKPAASAQAVSIHPAWIRQELMKPEVSGSGAVGGLMGFCTGLACRKAGEAAAVGLGAAFCFLGVLAKSGYITIDIPKIEKSLLMMLDMNKDGKLSGAEFVVFNMEGGSHLNDAAFKKQCDAWLDLAKARKVR